MQAAGQPHPARKTPPQAPPQTGTGFPAPQTGGSQDFHGIHRAFKSHGHPVAGEGWDHRHGIPDPCPAGSRVEWAPPTHAKAGNRMRGSRNQSGRVQSIRQTFKSAGPADSGQSGPRPPSAHRPGGKQAAHIHTPALDPAEAHIAGAPEMHFQIRHGNQCLKMGLQPHPWTPGLRPARTPQQIFPFTVLQTRPCAQGSAQVFEMACQPGIKEKPRNPDSPAGQDPRPNPPSTMKPCHVLKKNPALKTRPNPQALQNALLHPAHKLPANPVPRISTRLV